MNTIKLNTIGTPIGGGGNSGNGGGGGNTPSTPKWTGHADAEGLKAIGWTDEDIAYYQENGVNWNEEDDEYHKVSEDNKALYGVLTADNISTYKDRIVYLPKIDTSEVTDMYDFLMDCMSMVAMPKIDTSKAEDMEEIFYNCTGLSMFPELDFSSATSISAIICYTGNIRVIPPLDLSNTKIEWCNYCFGNSWMLERIENLILPNGAQWKSLCNYDYALKYARIDVTLAGITDTYTFDGCYALVHAYIKGVHTSLLFKSSPLLSKDSLLYIINNETATSAIVITLHASAYSRLATDPDITAALAAHPNVSLAK